MVERPEYRWLVEAMGKSNARVCVSGGSSNF